jgi:hypothetical protein
MRNQQQSHVDEMGQNGEAPLQAMAAELAAHTAREGAGRSPGRQARPPRAGDYRVRNSNIADWFGGESDTDD